MAEVDASGRVAVITGASRGLGAGMARAFAGAGVRLGLCARSEVADWDGVPEGALAVPVDVTDAEALDAFAQRVVTEIGPIDLWVNNAGVLGPIAPIRAADPDELATNVAANLTGVMYGTRWYAAHVHRRGRAEAVNGVLVTITSGAARTAYQGWGAYGSTKAGVEHLMRITAGEEADAGLRALAVAPGVVDTAMQAMIRSSEAADFPTVERFRELARTGGFNSPEWVGHQILDLAFGDGPPGDDVVIRIPDQPR